MLHGVHRCSDDACGAQLSQEHDDQEFPTAFLSHKFTDTQWKWSTVEPEAYDIYYAVKSGTTIYRYLTLLSAMTTSFYRNS